MQIDPWQLIKKRSVYHHRLFDGEEQEVRLPNGDVIPDMFVVKTKPSAVVVALTSAGKVVVNRQFRNAVAKILIDLPGGIIEPGEDHVAAAQRELLEETGYAIDSIRELGLIHAEPMTLLSEKHVFMARGARKVTQAIQDPQEQIETLEFSWDEISDLIQKNDIQDAATLAALYLASQHK